MNTRNSLLTMSVVLALAAAPATQAANADRAIDSCVAAFVDTYLPKGTPVRVDKQIPAASPLDLMVRPMSYTIALQARKARTHEPVAQARCVASARGDVIVLDSPLTDAYIAKADFAVVLLK